MLTQSMIGTPRRRRPRCGCRAGDGRCARDGPPGDGSCAAAMAPRWLLSGDAAARPRRPRCRHRHPPPKERHHDPLPLRRHARHAARGDRPRDLPDPQPGARARRPVPAGQLDGHPRPRAGDRRHRRAGAPRAVAGEGVRGGRARGRALDLPVARRRRPHRRAVRRARALPAGHAGDQLLQRRTAGSSRSPRCRWRACAGSSPAAASTPATACCKLFRPPVFDGPTSRGLFDPKSGAMWIVDSLPLLHARPARRRRDAAGPAGAGDAGAQQRDLALARLAGPGRLHAACRRGGGPGRAHRGLGARPGAARRAARRRLRPPARAGRRCRSSRRRARNCSTALLAPTLAEAG